MIETKSINPQEAFGFRIDDDINFDSFISADDGYIVATLQKAIVNCNNELYFIVGPYGCGKTHLLTALFHSIKIPQNNAFFLDLNFVKNVSPKLISDEPRNIMLLDNIDAVAGDSDLELALFALFNRWVDRRHGCFIATASCTADKIPFIRKDLNTRFANGVSLFLNRLDDQKCADAIYKKAAIRGINLDIKTCSYLVKQTNRDMPSLVHILDKLDKASLQAKHEITIPFIKKVLNI